MEILKFEILDSTQKKAKELLNEGKAPWTIILAESQTAGIGRKLGKERDFWYSPKGGLYFSIILPEIKSENLEIMNILAAFCVAKILKENFGLEPFIKLPNDVWVNGKKICGILTENIILGDEPKGAVMGIGLNTNIENFPEGLQATSLQIELGKKVNNEEILRKILKEIKNCYNLIGT